MYKVAEFLESGVFVPERDVIVVMIRYTSALKRFLEIPKAEEMDLVTKSESRRDYIQT